MSDAPTPLPFFEWRDGLRKVRLSTTARLLAHEMASYADGENAAAKNEKRAKVAGTNAYPGNPRLCETTGASDSTVRRALAECRKAGVLYRVPTKRRQEDADEYWLVLPHDEAGEGIDWGGEAVADERTDRSSATGVPVTSERTDRSPVNGPTVHQRTPTYTDTYASTPASTYSDTSASETESEDVPDDYEPTKPDVDKRVKNSLGYTATGEGDSPAKKKEKYRPSWSRGE